MRTLVAEAALALSLLTGVTPMTHLLPLAPMGPGGWAGAMDAVLGDWSIGAADEGGRVADETHEDVPRLIGDACGGAFEGGSPSIACDLPQGLPACGEPLWPEACSWAGHELGGWWTDPVDGIMVAGADGLVVPSLEEVLAPGDVRELTLYAHWDTVSSTRRIAVCHQRPDGTYGDPDDLVEVEADAGGDVTWWCEETDVFCAVTRTWTETPDEGLTVEVPRRTWMLTLVVDGERVADEEVLVGAEVDLAALAEHLGVEGDVVSWHALTSRGEVRLDARDTVSDLVGAGDECILEARLAPAHVTVAFLPGCEPEEVEGRMDDLEVAADEGALTLPGCAYARAGFSFAGWACDAASVRETLGAGDALDVAAYGTGRIELVAVWEPCQVKVSVPVAAALGEDGGMGACVRRSTLTLSNDSDTAVELAGVEVATTGPWRLVEWGSVVEDTDVALVLETADGIRCDLSHGVSEMGGETGASVRIEEGPATAEVTVLCEMGTSGEEGELCSLRWAFRAVDAGGEGGR